MDCILGNMGTERLSGIEIQAFLETVLIGTPAVKKKKNLMQFPKGSVLPPHPHLYGKTKYMKGRCCC